jgi:hypothetical protein
MYAPGAGAYRDPVQIRYGHITGCCRRCGGTEFAYVEKVRTLSCCLLRCTACGAATRYGDIMCQIGDAAVREARASLRRLRARYRRTSPPEAQSRSAAPGEGEPEQAVFKRYTKV